MNTRLWARFSFPRLILFGCFPAHVAKPRAKNSFKPFPHKLTDFSTFIWYGWRGAGHILQAILVSFLPTLMESKRRSDGSASNPDFDRVIAKQIKDFVDTIVWYARRDVDKSQHEDKHLFRVSEIMAVGHKNGLEVAYYPNAGYDTVAFEHSEISFEHELFHNLRVNFGFGNGIVEILKEHMSPYLQMIQSISPNGGSPYVKGVFSCKRIA